MVAWGYETRVRIRERVRVHFNIGGSTGRCSSWSGYFMSKPTAALRYQKGLYSTHSCGGFQWRRCAIGSHGDPNSTVRKLTTGYTTYQSRKFNRSSYKTIRTVLLTSLGDYSKNPLFRRSRQASLTNPT